MKVRLPRWVATVPFSLALHVIFVAAAIAVLRTEFSLPPLVIDLKAIIAGRDDGSGADAARPGGETVAPPAPRRAPAPSPVPRPLAPAPPAPAPAAAAPTASAPAPPPAAPSPPAAEPRAVESAPLPPPTLTSPLSTSDASSTGAGERRPSGGAQASADTADPGASDSGSGSGARGGGAADGRVAAIPPGTGSGDGTGLGSEYAGYYARLRERIQESLRYPAPARRRGLAGTVQLEIAIAADGAIAEVSVIGSSSHEMLDRAAVDAARSVRRVPFPGDVRPRPLTVRLPVVFELQ